MKATTAEIKRLAVLNGVSRLEQLESYKDLPGIYERLIVKAREAIAEEETAKEDTYGIINQTQEKERKKLYNAIMRAKDNINAFDDVISDLILFEAWQRLPADAIETYFVI